MATIIKIPKRFIIMGSLLVLCMLLASWVSLKFFSPECEYEGELKTVVIPDHGNQIIELGLGLGCYATQCFQYKGKNNMQCFVFTGVFMETNNETTCLIGGEVFEITCIMPEKRDWSCMLSPRTPADMIDFTPKLKLLFYDEFNKECCVMVGRANDTSRYQCYPSTTNTCINFLFTLLNTTESLYEV